MVGWFQGGLALNKLSQWLTQWSPLVLTILLPSYFSQASLIACAVSSLTFCFCTASASLLGACCGTDKPSHVPASVTSGRKRSVALILLSIGLSLAFQYGVAPAIVEAPSALSYLRDAWTDGCNVYEETLQAVCVGNLGVFRVGVATMIFFLLAALAAWCKPSFNREVWPAKFVLYLFLVAAMCFIPNEPLFSDIYLHLGRIGGVLFIFLQQLIIVDCAHNWNDAWVAKSDTAEAEEAGAGKKWLGAILLSCVVLFVASLIGLVLMFIYFTGCRSNTAFIASTLCLCLVITAAQLFGGEGSLLSSACVTAWAVYLLYNAVTKNPNEVCNPMLGQSDQLSIALGIIITVISLGWTGWSYTAEDKLTASKDDDGDTEAVPAPATSTTGSKNEQPRKVTGIVTGEESDMLAGGDYAAASSSQDQDAEDYAKPSLSNSWRLNMILVIVSCWISMTLTKWGDISTDGSVANPSVGDVAMWMLMASQWIVLLLYLWTLVAPTLFPDRDFS